MKVAIDEISRFMTEGWPKPNEDWYMDDCDADLWEKTFSDGGYMPSNPGEVVRLEDFACSILYQGSGRDPGGKSFVEVFKQWRRSLTTTTLVVEVPTEKLDTLLAFIAASEGKVLTKH